MFVFVSSTNPAQVIGDSKSIGFVELLKTRWDSLHRENGIFRYKIDNLQEKVLNKKYLLQLNPDRSAKRRTPELINDICQPFDKNKFNFTKVSASEVMFNIVREDDESDMHSMIVNVSPISRYHSLFCPSIAKCLPQVVTEKSLVLALEIMILSQHRDLKIGFNSLCALASVNHLHYHLFLESNRLPVETAQCIHLKGPLYRLANTYPVPAFCFEVQVQFLSEIAKDIYKLLVFLIGRSIAHNLFITTGLSMVPGNNEMEVIRVLIWPRKSSVGVKQLTAFNVAVCELSGWFPVFNNHDYDSLKTEDLENELKKWTVDDFQKLSDEVKLLF